jgi:glutamate-1-semialdehyde 2,1-aminomutase
MHSGTFDNDVLSMAGGVAALGEVFDGAAAEAHYRKEEKLRERLNAIVQRRAARLQFAGLRSMMQPHFRRGELLRRFAATAWEEAMAELLFFDMLASGIYRAPLLPAGA